MNDDTLISLVQTNDMLYNKLNRQYKDSKCKKEIWEQIGLTLGASGDVCSKRWTALRDKYCRELRRMEGSSGSGAVADSSWQHFHHMDFLRGHMHARKQISNFSYDSQGITYYSQGITYDSQGITYDSQGITYDSDDAADDAEVAAFIDISKSLKTLLEKNEGEEEDMEAYGFAMLAKGLLTGMEAKIKYKLIGDMTAMLIAAKNDSRAVNE